MTIWFTVKCLPDVSQELEEADLPQPVPVVDEQRLGSAGSGSEIEATSPSAAGCLRGSP